MTNKPLGGDQYERELDGAIVFWSVILICGLFGVAMGYAIVRLIQILWSLS